MNTRTVVLPRDKAHLKNAFQELQQNATILCRCSEDVKEAIGIAKEHGLLLRYTPVGCIVPVRNGEPIRGGMAYVIEPDIKIEVEEEKPEKVITCEIKTGENYFRVYLPNGHNFTTPILGIVHLQGYKMVGFIKANGGMTNTPRIGVTHTVWKKNV